MVVLILILMLLICVEGYHYNRIYNYRREVYNNKKLYATAVEDGVNLSCLSDVDVDSKWLGSSLEQWLNEEYLILPIHKKIGEIVSEVYIKSRTKNILDLGEMLMEIGTTLESIELSDAFVNAWDIANKASDLLMIRMNRELCSCAGDLSSFGNVVQVKVSSSSLATKPIPTVGIDLIKVNKLTQKLRLEFNRYQFLRDFLEEENNITWKDVHVIIALVLGFRIADNGFLQNQELAPKRWTGLDAVPDFSNDDPYITEILSDDLPEESEATDIMLESIIGTEMLKIMSTQNTMQRKILVSKWLYVNGFLTNPNFPISEKNDDVNQNDER